MVQTRCTPVSSRPGPPAGCRCSSIAAASTSMLVLRRLPPNEEWLSIFRDGVLTALEVLQRVAAQRLMVSSRWISGRTPRRASALYMWYACRYELRAPMMGLNGSLMRSPKSSLSQGRGSPAGASESRGSKVGPGLTTLGESSWHAHRRAAISVTPFPLSLDPVRIDYKCNLDAFCVRNFIRPIDIFAFYCFEMVCHSARV